MKTVAIIQARMGSIRLPGKVMADLGRKPVLAWVVRAAQSAQLVDQAIVATPDVAIWKWCAANEVDCIIGPEDDVLRRFQLAAEHTKADLIVRLTADCPFLDPALINACITCECSTTEYWPDGMDVQVFRPSFLKDGDRDKEHVIAPRLALTQLPGFNLRRIRVTLDTPADLDHLRMIAQFLPKDRAPRWRETLNALREVKAAA